MRRLTLILVVVTAVLAGCTRETPKSAPVAQLDQKPPPQGANGNAKADPPIGAPPVLQLAPITAGDKQEKYDAALNDALTLLAERKLPEALTAMEAARTFDDNDFIRGEIAKVKQRLDQDNAAKTTVASIATVLDEGKAVDAARLSTDALKEFGGGGDSQALIKLQLQADALASVQKDEDGAARYNRYRTAGEAALAEKNLRAAALAFEQAILAREDAALQQKLDAINADLQKYDALRARAAELRKDPQQLEEAITALKGAQEAWDTLPVRQELDEYTLALQKRRDTISVARFEVRTDLGVPDLGQSFADELLPRFKARFDLIERTQLDKVMAELKLDQALPGDTSRHCEAAKLARARYLVVGSIYSLAGITVQARLVDVQSGLVVQTAKVVAPTVAEAVALAPELARQLLMNDEQKLAFDQAQQEAAKAPPVIVADAPLPPPPAPAAAPVAVEVLQVALPRLGGLRIEVFKALPPPPAAGVVILPPPEPLAEGPFRRRLLVAALQRGDWFFLAGNFGEAQRQFEFALMLAPGNPDILLRLDRCRLLLPPPAPVVVVVAPPIIRPRVAILNFLVAGDPLVVPPSLGGWTPLQLAPYVADRYDVVDPALVYWYMGSLGMTVNDLMTDPAARRWLGRALGVRYFLLGTIEQTASFDVATYLIDAEFGFLQGSARVHVNDPFELRLRMGELALLTLMDPAERQRLLDQAQGFDALVSRGRAAMRDRNFAMAVQLFDDALRLRPLAFDVRFYRHQAHRAAEQQALERQRQQYLVAQADAYAAAQRRQVELSLAADQARVRAQQQAAVLAAAERAVLERQRAQAQTVLIKQAQVSFQSRRFGVSVSIYESAVAIAPPPAGDPWRQLAQARVEAARQTELVQAQAAASQEAALRKQREQELATAQAQIEAQRKQIDADRQARVERDKQAYSKAMAEGQQLLTKGNYDGAASAFLVAKQLQRTPAVDSLLELTAERRAIAQGKTESERKQLEAKLDAERVKRVQAEADAKRNQERYVEALKLAQAALEKKDYDAAQAKFTDAGKVFKTDAVLTGLQQVAQARARDDAAVKAQQAENDKATRVKQLLVQGQAALAQKQYADAVKTFQQARQLAPNHVEVLAGLSQAENGRDQLAALDRKKSDDAQRLDTFQKLFKSGQANLAAKQYDAAVANLTEALKLNPGDTAAAAALKQAEQARSAVAADAKTQAETKQKLAVYQKFLAEGQSALNGKQYDVAIKAFTEAQKLLPGDAASKDFLAAAQKGKKDAADAVALAAQKQADEQRRKAGYQAALLAGQQAYAAKNYAEAVKAYTEAARLMPGDTQSTALLKQAQQAFDDSKLKLPPPTTDKTAAPKDKPLVTDKATPPAKDKSLPPVKDSKALYQKAMQDGAAMEKQQKYADAVKTYQEALKLVPNDTQATAGLRRAQANLHVVDGQRFLDAGQFVNAQREFEAALKLAPGNPTVTKLLEKAKPMKK
jgi:tetratricopeptide (TPR) repeat protein